MKTTQERQQAQEHKIMLKNGSHRNISLKFHY
jgi:hypothetical protein